MAVIIEKRTEISVSQEVIDVDRELEELIKKQSAKKSPRKVNLYANRVVKVNSVMFGSNLNRMKKEKDTNSRMRSPH